MEYTMEANVARTSLNASRFLSLKESESSSEASGPELDGQNHVLKDKNRKDDFSSSTPAYTILKKKTKTPHLSPITSSGSNSSSGIPIAPDNAKSRLSLRARAQLKAADKAKAQLNEPSKVSNENERPDNRGNKEQKNTVLDKGTRKTTKEVIHPKSGVSKPPVVHSPILEDEEPENDNEEEEEPNLHQIEPEMPLTDGKHYKGVKTIVVTGSSPRPNHPRITKSAASKDKDAKIDSSEKVTSSTRFKLPVAVKRKEAVKKSSIAKTSKESDKRTVDRPRETRAETDSENEDNASNVKKLRTNKSGDQRAGVGSSGYGTLLNSGKNGEVEEEILSEQDEPIELPKTKTRKRKSSAPKQIKRLKPGLLALKEIKRYQRSTELLIKKSPFSRLVREICQSTGRTELRWAGTALEALQEATEAYLVTIFEQSYLLTHHAKRVTLMASDMRLLNRLRS